MQPAPFPNVAVVPHVVSFVNNFDSTYDVTFDVNVTATGAEAWANLVLHSGGSGDEGASFVAQIAPKVIQVEIIDPDADTWRTTGNIATTPVWPSGQSGAVT